MTEGENKMNFFNSENKAVAVGEEIIFENRTESPFAVMHGIAFNEDGEYSVSVKNKRIIVTKRSKAFDWIMEGGEYHCPKCGARFFGDIMDLCNVSVPNYCPNCGTRNA